MGGLMALHLALRRPVRVAALVLVAPAVSTVFEDFRERLPTAGRAALAAGGAASLGSEYLSGQDLVTEAFFEAARRLRLPPPAAAAGGAPSEAAAPHAAAAAAAGEEEEKAAAAAAHGAISISCPVRILHGARDDVVPLSVSEDLVHQLAGGDVALTIVKDGDHRLSTSRDLELLEGAVYQVYCQLMRRQQH
jgi:pimeloyl-ACP methyl ester carboxylesterase